MSCPRCGKAKGHWSNCPVPRFVWDEGDLDPVLPEQGAKVTVPDGREGTVFSASPGLPHVSPWASVDFGDSTDMEAYDLADL
jgi:hypothetical protein